ncbi:hypothetical protein ACF3N0_09030 [Moraxella atlantae]
MSTSPHSPSIKSTIICRQILSRLLTLKYNTKLAQSHRKRFNHQHKRGKFASVRQS